MPADTPAPAPATVICPNCAGRGSNPAFVDTAKGGWFDPALRCSLCGGTGQISHQTARWLAVGRQHYTRRMARDESVRECARRMGISASELSAMEHGRADPERIKDD